MTDGAHPERLRTFIAGFTRLVERHGVDEATLRAQGTPLLQELVARDDWLPAISAAADPERYQQHLLWCDPLERFSVVSFVWGPGQMTPVHDHMTWGLIGMLRGEEIDQRFAPGRDGRLAETETTRLRPGEVAAVSPTIGDIHQVRNALTDRASISIHIYGANIGAVRRHVFDLAHGTMRDFISGYSPAPLPNIWDRSRENPACPG